jgi:ABC-type Fe3+/spermidine/putrescine transport system ATPase subunit
MRLRSNARGRVVGAVKVKVKVAQVAGGGQGSRVRLYRQLAQQEGLALLVQPLRHLRMAYARPQHPNRDSKEWVIFMT